MSKLKALRKDEDLAAVPLDQPVLVDLEPEGSAVEIDEHGRTAATEKSGKNDDAVKTGVNVLEEQLKALHEANRLEREGRIAAERRAEQSDRDRLAAVNSQSQTEADAVQSGLAAAQAEQAAAKIALKVAGESGDWEAMAEANARIGRAASDIREFERSAALLADRKEQTTEVRQETQRAPSIDEVIDSMSVTPSERDWLRKHPEAVIDAKKNKELEVGYTRAMSKGLSRGTQEYFDYLDDFMGYAKPQTQDDGMSVSAPVSRNERGNDGTVIGDGKIKLDPEQRALARSMGLSDTEWAVQVAALDRAKKADPAKYGDR
jgi:hypothetical protein